MTKRFALVFLALFLVLGVSSVQADLVTNYSDGEVIIVSNQSIPDVPAAFTGDETPGGGVDLPSSMGTAQLKSVSSGSGGLSGAPQFVCPEVPVPAAVWLLGTGLLGLVGFRKKLQKR